MQRVVPAESIFMPVDWRDQWRGEERNAMRLEFADEVLEHLAYDLTATARDWTAQRLTLFRQTLFLVRNAVDPRDLKNMKSLAFRAHDDEEGRISVCLAGGPRLIIRITSEVPPGAEIIGALDGE
ncbi:plasmid maintenance system killer protein [Leifsonia sp. 563]|uniref:hypothetical protein n=1 Tax=Leifsonia sp. 563 TaxID=3156412 RepID=UPI00339B58CA